MVGAGLLIGMIWEFIVSVLSWIDVDFLFDGMIICICRMTENLLVDGPLVTFTWWGQSSNDDWSRCTGRKTTGNEFTIVTTPLTI